MNWTPVDVRLGDLKPWERNPKTISKAHAKRLLELWERLGQFQTIAIGPGGEVYDGHQRLNVLKAAHGAGYTVQALQAERALTEAEREELTVAAHVGTTGQFDWDALSGWDAGNLQQWGLDTETLDGWRVDAAALGAMIGSEAASSVSGKDTFDDVSEEFESAFALKADMHFPSKAVFGIPELRSDMLLELPHEIQLWAGDDLRHNIVPDIVKLYNISTSCQTLDFTSAIMAFYAEDSRFESVWAAPDKWATKIINSGLLGCVTPNFSLWPQQAVAVHIWQVYRSRWIGRYFQEAGISIIPDVNWAPGTDYAVSFAGIPVNAPCISIQVQTFSSKSDEDRHNVSSGIVAAVKMLNPQAILFYASKSGRELVASLGIQCRHFVLSTLMDIRREHLRTKGKLK